MRLLVDFLWLSMMVPFLHGIASLGSIKLPVDPKFVYVQVWVNKQATEVIEMLLFATSEKDKSSDIFTFETNLRLKYGFILSC